MSTPAGLTVTLRIVAAITLACGPTGLSREPAGGPAFPFLDPATAGSPEKLFGALSDFDKLDTIPPGRFEELLEIVEALELTEPLQATEGVAALHRHLLDLRPGLVPRLHDWIFTRSDSSTAIGFA
ncbi:MAG: hypothetical protein GWO24_28990, partial [Akkermansiaceae bacterium]|nr:hypothetical protein [Akkermansiaceae bacterium]